jgi:hypothetical protein
VLTVGWSARGPKMSDNQREIYKSENGDSWLLCRDAERVFVLHKANLSSGGTQTKIKLGDFLGRGRPDLNIKRSSI